MRVGRRFMALLLTCCMVGTGVSPMTANAQNAVQEKTKMIEVTDFGADPTGASDSAEAIRKAVAEAKKASEEGKEVTISFPEGRYDIYPDKAAERELYISNTVGADQAYKDKKIGILLEEMDNVTVDGNGSLLMFHGKMTTFAAIGCEGVTFRDFQVDFQVPTVVDVTVEKREGHAAVVYVPECYDYEIDGTKVKWKSDVSPYTGQPYWETAWGDGNMKYVQRFDVKNGLTWRGNTTVNPVFSNVASIEDLGDHRLKITYHNISPELQPGMCYQMRPTVRDHAGTFFWKSKDVVIENLDIYFLHGFGMVGQHSENIRLTDVDFEAPPKSGRTTAGYADFIQMSGCKGAIDISECTFSNPHDDPINVHGTFNQVVQKLADNKIKVKYMHNETAGFPNFFVGDQVEFMTKGNMIPVAESVRTVTAVDGPDGMGGKMGEGTENLTEIILTFDRAIPQQITEDQYVVENITYTPYVHIYDNVFKETPTRGILVTTRKPVVIERNTFDGMGMAGIYISNDAQGWYESGPTKDVLIRENVFTRGKAQAIFVEPTNPNVSAAQTVHENMTIEDNLFFLENQRVLDAKSVRNLTFKNNRIYRQSAAKELVLKADRTEIPAGESTFLTVNGVQTNGTRLYRFNGCQNVTVEGTVYDGGLNTGASYENMQPSEVKIKDDSIQVGKDSQTDAKGTVYYVSDHEEVVSVSANGKAKAVSEGTASVTAYMIVGGRKFATNTVKLTVTAASGEGSEEEPKKVLAGDITVEYKDETKYRPSETVEGGLEVDFSGQGLFNEQNPGNVIVKPLKEADRDHLTVTVKLTGMTPENTWADCGLYLYKTADHYVAIQKKHRSGSTSAVATVREENGAAGDGEFSYNNFQNVLHNENNEIWFKLEKTGAEVKGFFSTDAQNWTEVHSYTDCAFLGDDFNIAIASEGSDFGSMTYSDLTINGTPAALVEDEKNPENPDHQEQLPMPEVKSSDAYLKKAQITGFEDFRKTEEAYYRTAPASEKEITVNFAAEDAGAKTETLFNGKAVAGNAGTLQLASGRNLIEVNVTAEDGVTMKHYRFTVSRTGDSSTELASLEIDGKAVALETGKKDYAYSVEKDTDHVKIEAAAASPSAEVSVCMNGRKITDGNVALKPGSNQVVVMVTSETSAAPARYLINLKVPDAANAALESLAFGGDVALAQRFEKEITEYTGLVRAQKAEFVMTAEEADAKITVTVNGRKAAEAKGTLKAELKFAEGSNTVEIKVTSPDGSCRKQYRLLLEGTGIVYLSDIEWILGSAGWGTIQRDFEIEGRPKKMTLRNEDGSVETFEKGIGTHADSVVVCDLSGKDYRSFEASVGVDASQGTKGSVTFEVYIDDERVVRTAEMTGADTMEKISVKIPEGAQRLTLKALKGTDDGNDHADWADARFLVPFETEEAPQKPEVPFEDVSESDYFFNPVAWAYGEKIVEGYGDTGKFMPDYDCTRANVVTYLWRAAGSPEPENVPEKMFADVTDPEAYYYKAVLWAAEKKIVEGYGNTGKFMPDLPCSRGHIVTYLWRAAQCPEPEEGLEKMFTDVTDPEAYYYRAVLWAAGNQMVEGYGDTGKFMPDGICTRANTVTFLYRAAGKPLEQQ